MSALASTNAVPNQETTPVAGSHRMQFAMVYWCRGRIPSGCYSSCLIGGGLLEASLSAARGGHDWTMRSRYLAGVAAGWAFAYTCGYVALIHRQEESTVAWWFVALIAGGVVALGGVAAGRLGRQGLVLGLAVLVVATLLGAMTIGVFLIPAVLAALGT